MPGNRNPSTSTAWTCCSADRAAPASALSATSSQARRKSPPARAAAAPTAGGSIATPFRCLPQRPNVPFRLAKELGGTACNSLAAIWMAEFSSSVQRQGFDLDKYLKTPSRAVLHSASQRANGVSRRSSQVASCTCAFESMSNIRLGTASMETASPVTHRHNELHPAEPGLHLPEAARDAAERVPLEIQKRPLLDEFAA